MVKIIDHSLCLYMCVYYMFCVHVMSAFAFDFKTGVCQGVTQLYEQAH